MPGAYVDYVEDEPERPWWGTADQSASWFDAGLSRSPLTGDTEDEDIVIAVMGVTGVGKSTFIKTVSGRNDVITGESLSSGVSETPPPSRPHHRYPNRFVNPTFVKQRLKRYGPTNFSTRAEPTSSSTPRASTTPTAKTPKLRSRFSPGSKSRCWRELGLTGSSTYIEFLIREWVGLRCGTTACSGNCAGRTCSKM